MLKCRVKNIAISRVELEVFEDLLREKVDASASASDRRYYQDLLNSIERKWCILGINSGRDVFLDLWFESREEAEAERASLMAADESRCFGDNHYIILEKISEM